MYIPHKNNLGINISWQNLTSLLFYLDINVFPRDKTPARYSKTSQFSALGTNGRDLQGAKMNGVLYGGEQTGWNDDDEGVSLDLLFVSWQNHEIYRSD